MKKLSHKEKSELWSRLRKKDEIFDDLCNARDEVIRTLGHHEVVKRALISEIEKWDTKIEAMFSKALKKEITLKIMKK